METHTASPVLSAADRGGAVKLPEPDRVNVLFLTIDITIGGAERLVLDLARSLDRSLFAPSVGWFSEEEPPDDFRSLGIPLFPLRKNKGLDWRAMARLDRIVAAHRIHVINAHHFMSFFYAFYATRVARRIGLVFTEHSEHDVLSARGVWRGVGGTLVRSCDAVVGISPSVSSALRSHFHLRPGLVDTIENGVDVGLFSYDRLARLAARSRLGLDSGDVVIGHVANFRRNKNHLFLLRALREVVARRPAVKLIVVGQGFPGDSENSEAEVRAFIRDHHLESSVRLLGYRSDVPDLLRAMDVFCLVSHKEGLPISVIEAMASRLPVLGTDIPGLRRIVQPEVNGLLVPPDDVSALVAALERLASDDQLRRRLGDTAHRMAVEKYSLDRCVAETQRLLLSAARVDGRVFRRHAPASGDQNVRLQPDPYHEP